MADTLLDLTAVAPETQRDKTIKELFTSETTYVHNLQLMMDVGLLPSCLLCPSLFLACSPLCPFRV